MFAGRVDVDRLIGLAFFGLASLAALVSLTIIGILIGGSVKFFSELPILDFFTGTVWNPLFTRKQFGVLPLVTGTLSVLSIAVLVAVVPSMLAAIYLSEFASESFRSMMRFFLEIVAGLPTVVYGFLALYWATPVLKKAVPDLQGFSAFSAGVMTGLMIMPMLIYWWECLISSVPAGSRESSLNLGADRMHALFRTVLPEAAPGLVSVLLVGIVRIIGETMIAAIAGGQQAEFGFDLFGPVQTLTSFLFQASLGDLPPGSMEYGGAFAVAAVLSILTILIGFLSRYCRNKFLRRVKG